MVVGATLITRPSFLFGSDLADLEFNRRYPSLQRGYAYAVTGSAVMSLALLLVSHQPQSPWSLWLTSMAPVGVVVATVLLWTGDGFRLPVFHGAGKELAVLCASGFLVGLMNLLAHVLTVLAIQVIRSLGLTISFLWFKFVPSMLTIETF